MMFVVTNFEKKIFVAKILEEDNMFGDLQADEGTEGDKVVDEDVWHPGLPAHTSS